MCAAQSGNEATWKLVRGYVRDLGLEKEQMARKDSVMGQNAAFFAVLGGSLPIVEQALAAPGTDATLRNADGETIVMLMSKDEATRQLRDEIDSLRAELERARDAAHVTPRHHVMTVTPSQSPSRLNLDDAAKSELNAKLDVVNSFLEVRSLPSCS